MLRRAPLKASAARIAVGNEHRAAANRFRAKPRPACKVCGKPRRYSKAKTCSRSCGVILQGLNPAKPRVCVVCGVTFRRPSLRGTNKYCGRKCYYADVNKRPAMLTVQCSQCGVEFRRTRGAIERTSGRVFCGARCFAVANQGKGHVSFRGGKDNNRGPKWQARAERIRCRDGHCCRRCGKSQAENGRKLCVDHIIPWRVFGDAEKHLANEDRNLASLCSSCHSWKTSRAEQKWLRGDVLDFKRYEQALALPSAVRA